MEVMVCSLSLEYTRKPLRSFAGSNECSSGTSSAKSSANPSTYKPYYYDPVRDV
jgi:hypothetical protein